MKAIVIGRNYTSLLGMIRAVGEAGFDVIAIRTVKRWNKTSDKRSLLGCEAIEAASKYVKKHYFVDQNREEIIQFLIDNCKDDNQKALILPVDDYVASAIDLSQEKLRDYFLFPHINNSSGAVVRLMDKHTQKDLAKRVGLDVADGWVIDIKDGKFNIPDGIKYPVFTKPEISFLGNKRCMKKCNNEDELIAVINDVIKERDCPILVEQFVKIEKEFAILGCAIDNEIYIPDLIRMIRDGSGAHKGVTMLGEITSLDQNLEYVNKIKEFIRYTEFKGLFDIDIYEANGKMYFNELNLRFGASGYAVTSSGINLPAIFANHIIKNDCCFIQSSDLKPGFFLNEKVAYDDWVEGYITKNQFYNMRKKVNVTFIESRDDPEPWKIFTNRATPSLFKRLAKRTKRFLNCNL